MASMETLAPGAAPLPTVDLNRERREERRSILRRSRSHVAAIIAMIVFAAAVPLPLTLQTFALRQDRQKAEGQAVEVRQRLQSVTARDSELDTKVSQWTRLAQSQQGRRAWGAMLPNLAACLPDDVSLQQVQISEKEKNVQLQLQGSAGTMAGLRTFTVALAHSPVFSHMHLDEVAAGRATAAGGVTFQMAGPLNSTIGAEASTP